MPVHCAPITSGRICSSIVAVQSATASSPIIAVQSTLRSHGNVQSVRGAGAVEAIPVKSDMRFN
jgi:hypothetical protein